MGVDPLPADTLLMVTLKLNDLKTVLRQELSVDNLLEIEAAVHSAIAREIRGDA